nr:double-strand break repair protein AddB [uncultured Devosia sp.]
MTLFSIAPHAPFLATLADRILDGTLLAGWDRSGPFWLSDVTIILPTGRARLALADQLAQRGVGLLPDLRTLGGNVDGEEPFLVSETPPPPPQASSLERRLGLSDLVAGWAGSPDGRRAFSSPPTAAEILAMAGSLGELIDDLVTEERSDADLRAIAPNIEADLGEYWQQTLKFLDIALTYWPEKLREIGKADASRLRGQRLDRQASLAAETFGERPVIVAGSTGSIPATARLLKAINGLPRGAIVLPGLDCSLTPAQHEALLATDNAPHGHPQYGLARLLRRLDAAVSDVTELASDSDDSRTRLVLTAMALPDDTARWPQLRAQELDMALGTATQGLAILEARNEDEEARAIAIAARASLVQDRTVGIVTPDRNLARRIAAELRRFDIVVDDAAGTPLFQSAAGRLARQLLAVAAGGCAAVDIIALLRNRAVSFGLERWKVGHLADDIELGLLRGQRAAPGLDGLRKLLADNVSGYTKYPARSLRERHVADIEDLLDRLATALQPLHDLLAQPRIAASDLARAICATLDSVTDEADLAGGRELTGWGEQMSALDGQGHHFPPRSLETVLAALMTGFSVRTSEDRRQDIAIWGQLEARLMNPDLLILAGLNEDVWPEVADPGPWLSRGMRLAAGLEPPERRQGQAAHDFAQALGNDQVIIAYAGRVGTSPAQPSRLLQRLEAYAGKDLAGNWRKRGEDWVGLARRLDAAETMAPAPRPAPNPPAELRPRSLSVTQIETLMRSPYDIYANRVLRLKPIDPLGETADARERGNTVHEILSRFVEDGQDVMAPDAPAILQRIAEEEFGKLHVSAELRAIWLRRFETAARQFLDFEQDRNAGVARRHAEIKGKWALPMGFTLTGRADRVDEMVDGTLEIMDFKTGSVPQPMTMRAFEAPQLLLEAAMAQAGALEGVSPANSSALTYVKIGLGPDAFQPKPFSLASDHDVMSAADEIARRMQAHVDFFLFRDTPMPARLLPLKTQRFPGAYDHLSRMAEWTAVDDDEEELW